MQSLTTKSAEPPPSSSSVHTCTKCLQPIHSGFVNALDGTFHKECFRCMDCNECGNLQFYPVLADDGSQQRVCERDYFRRLGLVCENCGEALRGSYITAVGKKFHLEHFCCSICSVAFGPDDSYYEHSNKVYCHYHYSVNFAAKCTGCRTAILKQFVEMNRNCMDERWHPECYMIHKFWNITLALSSELDLRHVSANQLYEVQSIMEDRMHTVWTVLSAFEESAAACISDMLAKVSEGRYIESVKMAGYFIAHVEVLFSAIDDLLIQYASQVGESLHHEREAKMLCKKVVNFFSLLTETKEDGVGRLGITQDLISLVTGLAHYLKMLIRIGLTGALRMENQQTITEKSTPISRFLCCLMELTSKQSRIPGTADLPLTSDICFVCRKLCNNECFRSGVNVWHDVCLTCSRCHVPLQSLYKESFLNIGDMTVMCQKCALQTAPHLRQGFERVTQLQQFSSQLSIALLQLYDLLSTADMVVSPTADGLHQGKEMPPKVKLETGTGLGSIKRMKSAHMKRKLANSYQVVKPATLTDAPKFESANKTMYSEDTSIHHETTLAQLHNLGNEDALTLGDIPQLAAAKQYMQHSQEATLSRGTMPTAPNTSNHRGRYLLSELGALDHFMVKHIAIVNLDKILKDHFTLEELTELIDRKNATLWGKFVTSIKAPRPKEGTFGVPIEVLVERNGVETNLGLGPARLKIPCFIEDSISAMRQMDMSIEGIFRKNGNIRRLKDTCEEIDRNPNSVQLMNETPIQVAALTKKFLRDLPEPLLTFKLHKVFIAAQKLEHDAAKKRATHLAYCLLPKPNRDTIEVLFPFMKWVATFADKDEESGSKMDLRNLATVLAPNILYCKSKDPMKDESFSAIEAVHLLLRCQDEFFTIPEDFIPVLKNIPYGEGDLDLSVRDILKKCEMAKMSQSAATSFRSAPTRQHSSPAAVPLTVSRTSPPLPMNNTNHRSPAAGHLPPYPISSSMHRSASSQPLVGDALR